MRILEIIVIDNDSREPQTKQLLLDLAAKPNTKVIPCPGPFNFSAMNNLGAAKAAGDVLLMLNNDIEVTERHWLSEMVANVMRPEIGIVGAKLTYPNNRLQHGGVVLGAGGVAEHYYLNAHPSEKGYYCNLLLTRRVSCVTGACLAIRRAVYEEVGGLDAENLAVAYNDVDLCLKVSARGYHILWTPNACLRHHESASRGSDQTPDKIRRFKREQDFLVRKWGEKLQNDPFYNLNLSLKSGDHGMASESRRKKPWVRPTKC